MSDFEQALIPLAEYLGIPLIILTPLVAILFIIFKWVIPRIMNNSSRLMGQITMDIVANLFGEGTEKSIITGIEELEASKVIKNLPSIVHNKLNVNNDYVAGTVELIVMLSQAIMSERFIKSENAELLQNITKKGKRLLMQIENDREEEGKINGNEQTIETEETKETKGSRKTKEKKV